MSKYPCKDWYRTIRAPVLDHPSPSVLLGAAIHQEIERQICDVYPERPQISLAWGRGGPRDRAGVPPWLNQQRLDHMAYDTVAHERFGIAMPGGVFVVPKGMERLYGVRLAGAR